MKIVEVNSKKYEVIKDYRDALDIDEVNDKLTDYFESFDYILGDYAYGKLRLKGFNDNSNNCIDNRHIFLYHARNRL